MLNISDSVVSVTDFNGSILIYIFLIVTIVFGNILVIAAFATEARLQTLTNYWIVSLSLTDIILGVSVLPFQIAVEYNTGRWIFGETACDLFIVLDVLCCTCSIYHLCLISIDRFFLVRFPLQYPKLRTWQNTLAAIACTWTWCAFISSPRLFGWTSTEFNATSTAFVERCEMVNSLYIILSSVISFFIPLLVIIAMYIAIYGLTRSQIQKFQSQRQRAVEVRRQQQAELKPGRFIAQLFDLHDITNVMTSTAFHSSTSDISQSQSNTLNMAMMTSPSAGDIYRDPVASDIPETHRRTSVNPVVANPEVVVTSPSLKLPRPTNESPAISLPARYAARHSNGTLNLGYLSPPPGCSLPCLCQYQIGYDPPPPQEPHECTLDELDTYIEENIAVADDVQDVTSRYNSFLKYGNKSHRSQARALIDRMPRTSIDLTRNLCQRSSSTVSASKAIVKRAVRKSVGTEQVGERLMGLVGVMRKSADKQTRLQRSRQRQEQRAARVVIVIVTVFVMFWTPFFIVNTLVALFCQPNEPCMPSKAFKITTMLGYFNSAVNAFIYTSFNRTFRSAMRNVILLKQCRKRRQRS